MRRTIQDATAGQRARDIDEHPDRLRQIIDSTDPRFGELSRDKREAVVDATDPRFGKAAA